MTLPQTGQLFGVVFDMDGVLVDSAAPHLASWRQLALEHGRDVTDARFTATFGRQNRDIVPLLFGEAATSRWRELSDRKEMLYRSIVGDQPPIVAGAVRLIRSLRCNGFKLAIGSSGPQANIELIVGAMGIADCLDAIVSGDDVERGKPDPQVFTVACGRLGLEPGRCVVVEDAPAGVAAARAAGAKSVAVLLHHPREAFTGAEAVVPCLADLTVEFLLSLLSNGSA